MQCVIRKMRGAQALPLATVARLAVSTGLVAAILGGAPRVFPALFEGSVSAQSFPTLTVTGVAPNNSSAKVYYQPVAGARDYRVYDAAAPTSVKYAGLVHLSPSVNCPGTYCLQHFVAQADGATPVFPYQVASGATGGPQVLDVPATDIEWNSLGDNQPHTLIVEAVDQLGPAPQASLYTGLQNTPLVSPMPAGAMLGSNKGHTNDGNNSTNGEGPYTNTPHVIARSQPFVAQARPDLKAIPSVSNPTQQFFDTFENAENATIKQVARQDSTTDAFGNLGMMTYSMNAGTPKESTIEYRQADNLNSMPFVSGDHFMDMLFDGATPGTTAPTHTIYGSMAMTPTQPVDMSGGKMVHLTMEVDGHQSFRRWLAFDLAPASDPLQAWDANGHPINNTDQGVFLEIKDGQCTLDIFTGRTSATDPAPTGTAGGSAHGARLWGGAGSVGGAPIMCGWDQMFHPANFSKNGLGLDDRSRFDFYITQDHAALFEDGQLIVQSDIPAGSFPWAAVPLKAYYTHYLYHSDADIYELENFQLNGAGMCYPANSYWFNNPVTGTAAGETVCNTSYPSGYGFPYSDERHWDNMGFEVLPVSYVPANHDFSGQASRVQVPQTQAPQFTGTVNLSPTVPPVATATGLPTTPPTAVPTAVPATAVSTVVPATAVPAPTSAPSGLAGQWLNVTPPGINPSLNFGTQSVVVDPLRPSNLYFPFDHLYKSIDYGQTWAQIDDGSFGAGSVGVAIAPGTPAVLYAAWINTGAIGFSRSTNGGVSWTHVNIGPAPAGRQDVYPPSVDPYDGRHLVMTAHEQDGIYQSTDQGLTWTSVPIDAGMHSSGGTGYAFFINTGAAATTRNTWLWIEQGTGGAVGTWRTTNSGANWTKVSNNEHPHGNAQIYQPDSSGVVYMAGVYAAGGWGVLRSTDYGVTWTNVVSGLSEAIVYGTPNKVYGQYGWACGAGCTVPPSLEASLQPGKTGWGSAATPAGMTQGPGQAAVTNDGSNYIILTANWSAGIWRYVEPGSGPVPATATPVSATATATPVSPTATATPTKTPSATPTTPAIVPTSAPTLVPTQTTPPTPAPSGGTAQWASVNPPGLSLSFNNPPQNYGFNSIVSDPTVVGTIYMGTDYQGLYKSIDRGTNWVKIDTGAGRTMVDGGRIWSLAIDPFNHSTLYAASGYGSGGPLKSTDGGVSWTNTLPTTNPIEKKIGTNDVYNVAIDPFTPNHILASFHSFWYGNKDSGVLESVDGGAHWTIHNPPVGSGWGASNSVWFLDNSHTWLLGSESAGLWRTTNSGQSWTRVSSTNITHGGIYALHRNSSTGALFTAVSNGVLKSTDDGVSWQAFNTGLPSAGYETVASDGVNLYTAPSFPTGGDNAPAHGPWYTIAENGGTTWTAYNSQTPCLNSVCNGPVQMAYDAADGTLYAANWNAGAWKLQIAAPAPQPVATATATATATQQPAQPSYTSSASASPSSVLRGGMTSITASVTSTTAATALVDVEVYDPAGVKVFQQSWDNQSFTAGQPRTLGTTWSVPNTALTGAYKVKIGVFATGWTSLLQWNDSAATVTVT
jgi:hypothetical protein